MHFDDTNIFATISESSNKRFSFIKIPFTGTAPTASSLKIYQKDGNSVNNHKFSITNEGTTYFYLGGLMHSASAFGRGPFFAKISAADFSISWEFGPFGASATSSEDYINHLDYFEQGNSGKKVLLGCGVSKVSPT